MPRTRTAAGALIAVLGAGLITSVTTATPALADPSANSWYRLRMCESSNNYRINTGNGYYGAYQFDLSTWRSVGGTGYPNQASPAEQDARALILYRERGWQPWTCAGIVGLREDGDARSGRINDIHVGGGSNSPSGGGSRTTPPSPPASGTPAWPNTQYWSIGDRSHTIARWQRQMRTRGVPVNTDGVFGPTTMSVVNRIQRQNGLPATGLLGPVTWRLAWTGTYSSSAASKPVATKPPAKVTYRPTTAPPWRSSRYFSPGDRSRTIAQWQTQMHARGSRINTNGVYGPTMRQVVDRIQRLNGLPATGLLGPVTWKLAWTGRY